MVTESNAKNVVVLVVDDEMDIQELYAKRLRKVGFQVAQATNGQEAIDFLNHNECDAVICDINMPVKNGFDVFEFIRARGVPRLPFIFVTGHGEGTAEMRKALSLGADAVFSKPLSSKVLIDKLYELCGQPSATSPA